MPTWEIGKPSRLPTGAIVRQPSLGSALVEIVIVAAHGSDAVIKAAAAIALKIIPFEVFTRLTSISSSKLFWRSMTRYEFVFAFGIYLKLLLEALVLLTR